MQNKTKNYCEKFVSFSQELYDFLREQFPDIEASGYGYNVKYYIRYFKDLNEAVYFIEIQQVHVAYTDYRFLKLEIKNLLTRKKLAEEYFPCEKENLPKLIFEKVLEVINNDVKGRK